MRKSYGRTKKCIKTLSTRDKLMPPSEEGLNKMSQRIDDIEGSVKVFHGQIRALGDKLDSHNDALERHVEHFNAHEAEQAHRHRQFLDAHTDNTEAITRLTKSVAGVIEVYQTANSLGRFVKWFSGIAIAVTTLLIYLEK